MMEKIEDWYVWDTKITESTNDDALNFCRPDGEEKFVFSAQKQTKGRGRFDHKWEGGEENLLFSMLFPAELSISGMIALLCGYGVLKTILHFSPDLETKLKWPNDVLVENKKVCGILIERKDEKYIVAGIGVNLKYAPKLKDCAYEAAALSDFGISVERFEFLRVFLAEFNQGLEIIKKREFNTIKENWLKYAKGLHKKVRLENFGKQIFGEFSKIEDDGAIVIKTDSGDIKCLAGDLYYEKG